MSSPYGLYKLGNKRVTMIFTKSYAIVHARAILIKNIVFGLCAETRSHEGGITSNRKSACFGEYVPKSCTHRPSHAGSKFCLKFNKFITYS